MKYFRKIPLLGWFIIASLMLHAVTVIAAEKYNLWNMGSSADEIKPLDLTFDTSAQSQGGVLTDMKDSAKDPQREVKSPLISEINRRSSGQLTKEKGYNMRAPNASPLPGAGETAEKKTSEEGETEAADQKQSGGGELTENLNEMRFNFGEGMSVRVGSREYKNAGFYKSVIQSVGARLSEFIHASPFQNYSLVSADKCSCIISVDRSGNIDFIQMESPSIKQPVLNHYLQESVNYAGNCSIPPEELLGLQKDSVRLSFTLASSGPPAGVWWIYLNPLP